MTTTTAADTPAGLALAACTFVESRVRDEIARESHRYHHDACMIFMHQTTFGIECSCDGPERTRDTLQSVLTTMVLIRQQIEHDGTLCEDVRQLLRALVAPYRGRADFPRGI